MSRDISTSMQDTLALPEIRPFFAVQVILDETTLRLWTGLGDLVYQDDTYLGTGQFLSVSNIEETADISAVGASLSLSGIPSDLISLALTEPYQGRVCKIFFGVINLNKVYLLQEDGSYILAEDAAPIEISETSEKTDLTLLFSGYIDNMTIEEGAQQSTITLSLESRMIDLERTRTFRYTDQNQKSRYTSDRGFEFVEDLQDKRFTWGRS